MTFRKVCWGSISTELGRPRHVRFTPLNRLRQTGPTDPVRANSGLNKTSRITASELSLRLHQVPIVSIKIFEDRNDPILFFARFLAEYHAS